MNKVIYICATAMALVSCSNDEVVEQAKQNVISFRSVVGTNTKGTVMNTAGLQNNGKLYVTTFNEEGKILYDETEYTYDTQTNTWKSFPEQYWPNKKKLSFFLTYPKLEEWQTGAVLTKDSAVVTMKVDQDVAKQKDFVVAYMENVDEPASGTIAVELKHAFAQVEVRAKNTNPNYNYKVKGVRFANVFHTVNLNLATMAFDNADEYYYWDHINIKYDTPIELDDTPRSIMGDNGNAILPPQKNNTVWSGYPLLQDGAYIAVLIKLTTSAGGSVYPIAPGYQTADGEYAWAAVPVEFNWTSGNKYVYTLDFSQGAGQGDPYYLWDNTHSQPCPYILDKPMTFDVTVTPWTAVSSNVDFN